MRGLHEAWGHPLRRRRLVTPMTNGVLPAVNGGIATAPRFSRQGVPDPPADVRSLRRALAGVPSMLQSLRAGTGQPRPSEAGCCHDRPTSTTRQWRNVPRTPQWLPLYSWDTCRTTCGSRWALRIGAIARYGRGRRWSNWLADQVAAGSDEPFLWS